MASQLNNTRAKFSLNILLLLAFLAGFFINPSPVLADESSNVTLPDLGTFTQSVLNGQASELRGVYVPQVLAMPVVQQPIGNPGYVSSMENVITQFSMAAEVGNVGLLAHNYLAGLDFFKLAIGQEVSLVYGNGAVETYVIKRVLRYQALDPLSPYSEFRDLETGVTITAEQLFNQVYRGERHVTLQTCIANDGNSSWGRLFVIAEPKPIVVADSLYLPGTHIR